MRIVHRVERRQRPSVRELAGLLMLVAFFVAVGWLVLTDDPADFYEEERAAGRLTGP